MFEILKNCICFTLLIATPSLLCVSWFATKDYLQGDTRIEVTVLEEFITDGSYILKYRENISNKIYYGQVLNEGLAKFISGSDNPIKVMQLAIKPGSILLVDPLNYEGCTSKIYITMLDP